MADTDIFDNRFWVRLGSLYGKQVAAPFADNGAFVMNAVENLMGSSDLISLRTRATDDRPFTVVRDTAGRCRSAVSAGSASLAACASPTPSSACTICSRARAAAEPSLTPQQQAEIERFKRQLVQIQPLAVVPIAVPRGPGR